MEAVDGAPDNIKLARTAIPTEATLVPPFIGNVYGTLKAHDDEAAMMRVVKAGQVIHVSSSTGSDLQRRDSGSCQGAGASIQEPILLVKTESDSGSS